MSLIATLKGHRGKSGFGYASTAEQVCAGIDLSGKTALVTGVNSGLGTETARVLGARGAHIVALARTIDKARGACEPLGVAFTPVACDLADLASVRAAVAAVKALERPLDMLIANAGIMALANLETVAGIERQFFTNHIGHFVLVTGLLESLGDDARVVMLSSGGHQLTVKGGIDFDNLSGERGYSRWKFYGQSKLANLLFAVALAKRFEGTSKVANAVHPGMIRTNLMRHMGGMLNVLHAVTNPLYGKTVPQGAATTAYVAAHPDTASISGKYFADCNLRAPSRYGRDLALAERLWAVSEEIVARVG